MDMTILDIAPGYAKAEARYSEEMCNFNGLIHGGAISFFPYSVYPSLSGDFIKLSVQ